MHNQKKQKDELGNFRLAFNSIYNGILLVVFQV